MVEENSQNSITCTAPCECLLPRHPICTSKLSLPFPLLKRVAMNNPTYGLKALPVDTNKHVCYFYEIFRRRDLSRSIEPIENIKFTHDISKFDQ